MKLLKKIASNVKHVIVSRIEMEVLEWETIVVSIIKNIEDDVAAEIKSALSFK